MDHTGAKEKKKNKKKKKIEVSLSLIESPLKTAEMDCS
jgi:hypothetical protein